MNIFKVIRRRFYRMFFSDKKFLEVAMSYALGYKVNLDNPKTFNEKLNWLKIYGRNPQYTMMADKYAVKKYISDKIGSKYVIPIYGGGYESFKQIDFESLPDSFVLKCTNQSGVLVVKDKQKLDLVKAEKMFTKQLKRSRYVFYKEWVYKDIPPRIIVEKFMDDNTGTELRDYKFWCFNGKPKIVYFTNKGKKVYENFYDMNFNSVNINHGFPRAVPEYEKPKEFEKMKELCSILSKDIPFVRVDFYIIEGQVYFGEFTFYDWGGQRPFESYKQDLQIGKLLKLPYEE